MERKYISESELPVGYRFAPTDEELVTHYLLNKARFKPLPAQVIQDIDSSLLFHKPPYVNIGSISSSKELEREWYFFAYEDKDEKGNEIQVRDGIGYWKAVGNEEPIFDRDGDVVAFKLHFIYYSGTRFTEKMETNWKMDKYSLPTYEGHQWTLLRLSNVDSSTNDYD